MERTVNQSHLQRIKRITGQYTIFHCTRKAFLYSRDKFFRNITTFHFVNKLQSAFFEIFINRTDIYDDISKLTTTSRLFLINFAEINRLSNSLLIVYLWLTLVTFYLKLTFQTVDNNIQVKLTHTGNNRLTSLFVSFHSERRVFFS